MSDLSPTIGSLLRRHVQTRPTQDFFVCDDERLTYAAADAGSRRLARALVAHGAGPSTHIGILMPTGADFVTAVLAATRIGAVAVPISTFSTADELRWILNHSDVGILLSSTSYLAHDYVASLTRALPGFAAAPRGPLTLTEAPALRQVFFSGDTAALPADRTVAEMDAASEAVADELITALESAVTPAHRMTIVHTSGSTSAPKGVVHQHGPLIAHLGVLNEARGLEPGMRLFSNSPLFWIGGFGYNIVGVLAAGATLICSRATDPAVTLDLIEAERPEMVNGFAQTVANLVSHPSFATRDFSSIRLGNLYPVMPDDVRPADPELRHNMLGLTEAGSVCLMSADENDQPERYRGSFGRPVSDIEARVVDPETLADCPTGQVGELWIRSPNLMEGYYGRPRHEVFTADNWFRTGDMFVVDEDGFHYFKGRRGDMIKTAGANVSPREVESALQDLFPTERVLVLGVDDAERDQIVVGIVIGPDDVAVDQDEVIRRLRDKLSSYKVPRRVLHLTDDAVPMLSSGKIDTIGLRASLTTDLSPGVSQ